MITFEMILLWAIVAGAVVLFSIDIFPVDKVSLLVLGSLVATGLVQSDEAISGFGNPATITVACMLALSYGVQRTGALNLAANAIIQFAGGSELKLFSSILITVGVLSAFINNTAAVALFLPLTLSVARKRNLDASKFLMPMSFAAMFAGTCTLVGSSTNLLIAQLFLDHGGSKIGMFDFAPMGLLFFGTGMLYLLTVGRRLLIPRRTAESLTEDYKLRHFVTELILRPNSPLLGKSVEEAALSETYNVQAVEIIRGNHRILPGANDARLQPGDILLVQGRSDSFLEMRDAAGVDLRSMTVDDPFLEQDHLMLVEAFVSPNSRLVDSTLKEVDFRKTYKANALAIRSHGRTIRQKIGTFRLEHGDSLLVLIDRRQLGALHQSQDFLVLDEVPQTRLRKDKLPWALGIFVGIILAASFDVLGILEASILGTALMFLTRCIRSQEVYSNLHWQTIVMLGCLIPLGTAMETTGSARFMAEYLVEELQAFGPTAVLSGLYLATTVLTSLMSNNATGVLMLPIAVSLGEALGTRPDPFVFCVMFAASASFMTPMGYQTNTFVFGPGGYKFSDFLRVGAPLVLLFWLLATFLIPVFWPFHINSP